MNESTEIANAIYYLASTIKSSVTMLGFVACLLWVGSTLLGGERGDKKR